MNRAGSSRTLSALAIALSFTGCAGKKTRTEAVWQLVPSPTTLPVCEDFEPAPADTRVLSVDEVSALKDRINPPRKLSGPDPQYTEEAISHRIQGTMLVTCRVMINGCVVGCRVLQSLPYMDGPILSTLQRRHYRPAFLDGNPVNVEYTFKITLRLP